MSLWHVWEYHVKHLGLIAVGLNLSTSLLLYSVSWCLFLTATPARHRDETLLCRPTMHAS